MWVLVPVMRLAYHVGHRSGIVSSMENAEKVRENRLRRWALRQGFELHKSRTRDHRAKDYGTWVLVSDRGKPKNFRDIDALEQYLSR